MESNALSKINAMDHNTIYVYQNQQPFKNLNSYTYNGLKSIYGGGVCIICIKSIASIEIGFKLDK